MKSVAAMVATLLLALLLAGPGLGCDTECNNHPDPPPVGETR